MGRLWDWGILCLWHTIVLQWEPSYFWNKIRAHVWSWLNGIYSHWIWTFWIKGSFDGLWEGCYKTAWIRNVWSYNWFPLELILEVIIAGNEVRRHDEGDNNCKFWVGLFKLTLLKMGTMCWMYACTSQFHLVPPAFHQGPSAACSMWELQQLWHLIPRPTLTVSWWPWLLPPHPDSDDMMYFGKLDLGSQLLTGETQPGSVGAFTHHAVKVWGGDGEA